MDSLRKYLNDNPKVLNQIKKDFDKILKGYKLPANVNVKNFGLQIEGKEGPQKCRKVWDPVLGRYVLVCK